MSADFMAPLSELSVPPERQGDTDSCLLLSYGAALFPFLAIPEKTYFQDVLSLLGQKPSNPLELEPQLVDSRIGIQETGSGYDWIEGLHHFCPGASFARARSQILLSRVRDENLLASALKSLRATSIVSVDPKHHSILVGFDSAKGFFARNSARSDDLLVDAIANDLDELLEVLYPNLDTQLGESILFQPA